ncbi:WXG100 family type VII secretion target [Lentzea atacamensis]|uniref:ESAT-6-like protein n=1 Tax=Lentzea atacamensis TaxID=531938 RepID=A0A316ISA5_9PSEU|nr:WXG100 family type VII secretion target [Lentzea atacamensis]PWK90015.1 WXG100 family type VII secretion target [Lentzea atacamensis]
MSGFGVSSEELDALAKRILEVDEQAQAKLRQVRNAADTVRASWKGTASTAFQNLIDRFDADAAKVQEALREIASQISESSKTYLQNEQAQEESIGTIGNRLG